MKAWGPLLALFLGASCGKVPLYDVGARFSLADTSWFEAEETLFVFYDVAAEQGLTEFTDIEIRWETDEGDRNWTPLSDLTPVHTHLPVDCGFQRLCGSMSVRVPLEPRDVRLRLRYHRDGELAVDAVTAYNTVPAGAPHRRRSALVYGVFDPVNQFVQWRTRNQFPTIRNMQASDLGLRRRLKIEASRYGTVAIPNRNPYGYGIACDGGLTPTGHAALETEDRAKFHLEALPEDADTAPHVCATATVWDAKGPFATSAVAQKNPETRDGFSVFRNPTNRAVPLRFFLAPCGREISPEHAAMQRQRLLAEDIPITCTDGWQQDVFLETLVSQFRDAIDRERPTGRDMVLVVGLHQDEDGLSEVVEEALLQILPPERTRSSPRVAGGFVFDSTTRGLENTDLAPSTLWCPSTLDVDTFPDASTRSCPTLPDQPDIIFGPLQFNFLQILPNRNQYLSFIDEYGERQAGSVEELEFLTPELTPTSEHLALGDFGIVTFPNGEFIAATEEDAFSYCQSNQPVPFVLRSEALQTPSVRAAVLSGCLQGAFPADFCATAPLGLVPLYWIPEWHSFAGEESYEVGMFWEFPFLLRMKYEFYAAGAASALGFTVPFGFASPSESYLGTSLWTRENFRLDEVLTQCTRWCEHPTFDNAGVYNVEERFRTTYAHACYAPRFPLLAGSGIPYDDPGFPLDP